MYYDKSVFSEEDVKDLATMVAVAETKGGKIRYALENAWYTASFFFATGCESSWTMNAEGKWTGVTDTFNSDAGLISMKGMQILAKSPAYDSNADIFTDAVAIVTGTWNSKTAADHFGENLAATKLPSFTVDGKAYQLGSYFGCKLMGVKPQSGDNAATKTAVLQLLAQFLTNKDNQLERYETFGWGPSNLEALATDAVKNDISLKALFEQKEFAIQQGNINGSWWDIAKLLGSDAKNLTTDDELRGALKTYEDAVNNLLKKTDEELNAWGVIGSICGTNWDTDFPMTEQADGSFLSNVLDLTAGSEFKVRQGGSWDVNYGEGGAMGGANIKVEADGKYQVKLTLGDTVTVELIPVN
jgi:arabinogalactan oligomer/maltooligosaccharide transport system substrate-binding protein